MSDYVNIHRLNIIYFVRGATDPLQRFRSHGVRSVLLADGAGTDETYVSCLHFDPGGWITDPPADRDRSHGVRAGGPILVSV